MSVTIMSAVFAANMPELKTDDGKTVPDSTSKFVLLALADHASEDGENAYIGVKRICQKTNLSTSTVCNALNALRTNGIIELVGKSKADTNNYTINIERLHSLKFQPLESGDSSHRNRKILATEIKPSINHQNNHDDSFSKSAKTDETQGEYKLLENSDPAFLMANDQPITDEAQQARILEHNAITAFEASFSALRPLAWFSGKPKWTHLRRDVVELYKADPQCFEKYKVWRTTPYVKGAVSLKDIQRDPDCFIASWAGFVEAVKPQQETNTPKVTIVK